MFSSDVLGLSSEHSQSKSPLNELVSIDGWGNGVDDSLADVRSSCKLSDLLLVLVGQLEDLVVSESLHIVRLDDRLEDGEAVLDIGEVVKPVDVDTCDLHFISWASAVHQVIQHIHFFLSGNSSRRDTARCFLDGHLLVVPVECLLLIDNVVVGALALVALPQEQFPLILRVVVEGTLHVSADASVENLVLLWEHSSSLGHHSLDVHQCVQVDLSEISEFVVKRHVLDSDEDLSVDLVVVGEDLRSQLVSYFVEDGQNQRRFFSKPNSKSWVLLTQVVKCYFKTLFIICTHFVYPLFINMLICVVFENSEEIGENLLDPADDLFLLDPLRQFALDLFVVDHILHFLVLLHHPALLEDSPLLLSDVLLHEDVLRVLLVVQESSRHPSVPRLLCTFLPSHLNISFSSLIKVELILVVIINSFILISV